MHGRKAPPKGKLFIALEELKQLSDRSKIVGQHVGAAVAARTTRASVSAAGLRYARPLFDRAAELRLPAFVARPAQPVYDDHVPLLQAGIPAVDLIDFDFPEWHTTGDVPAVCDPASLGQVGTLAWSLARSPLPGF